eukprot:TRINITY_DN11086_c0_g1_i1.p1 TRINITY_DN11086_c0_g1~~TRINITY_DN11086_c0_g1_i1.p1  ORF type:complete len:204 (+),score=34.71 TRINITY_DN11086_c0_g1_i1:73-612(+)
MASMSVAHAFARAVPGRSKRGLYHGKQILYGSSVCFSDKKNPRRWMPNVQRKKYHSDLLDCNMRLRITTHAMKIINKMGGLDNYLLFTKPHRLGEGLVQDLRSRVVEAWEEKNGQQFNRGKIMLERQLQGWEMKRVALGLTGDDGIAGVDVDVGGDGGAEDVTYGGAGETITKGVTEHT